MKRSEKVTIAVILLVLWGLLDWPPLGLLRRYHGARDGRVAAETDLAAGQLRLQIGGYASSTRHRRHTKIALERYGIEIVNTGCVPDDYKTGYSFGYNERAQVELDRRYPGLTPERLWQEAEDSLPSE